MLPRATFPVCTWNRCRIGRRKWYFSILNSVDVLTNSPDYNTGRESLNKLERCLKEEGNELVMNCHQLKITAADGKKLDAEDSYPKSHSSPDYYAG
jgi:hypothetical protein